MAAKNARHKSFGSPVKQDELDPIGFELYGEEYECNPAIQGRDLLLFSKGATSDDTSEVTDSLLMFFEKVLKPESMERLNELWDDPERIVPIETMTDIIEYLIEEYTDADPKPSNPS